MLLELNKVLIVKNGLTGQASADYNIMKINKIFIDLTNGSAPVTMPNFDKIDIVSGKVITDLKELILDLFQTTLAEAPDAIYEVTFSTEINVKKV
jgi:hypothetical protein